MSDLGLTIGNVLDVLAEWPAASIHCVVTSPPYWGLRSYQGDQERVWGGDECEHEWGEALPAIRAHQTRDPKNPQAGVMEAQRSDTGTICRRCGAWRGAFGIEPLHDCGRPRGELCSVCYVCHSVTILRAIRRVMRPDGVCFWNIGDNYAGSGGAHANDVNPGLSKSFMRDGVPQEGNRLSPPGLKPGDLCMIPQRVALAAQADGWFVRSEIVWAKVNPMPESISGWTWQQHRVGVRSERRDSEWRILSGGRSINETEWQDCPGCAKCSPNDGLVLRRGSWRPTTAHEKVLMFAASENYWADGEDVREAHADDWYARASTWRDGKAKQQQRGETYHPFGEAKPFQNPPNPAGRNLRTVWTLPTVGYPGSHFATFPPALPTRCILAGCPPRVCAKCGTPWARVIEKAGTFQRRWSRENAEGSPYAAQGSDQTITRTTGFRPTCSCGVSEWLPGIVLDPFAGSGTTLKVAQDLGRRWAGIEICEAYADLIRQRLGRVTELPEPEGDVMPLPMEVSL